MEKISRSVATTTTGLLAALVMAVSAGATSAPNNVALGKPVTLIQGVEFNNGVTAPAPLSVITDGTFLPEGTCFSCAYGSSVQWANPQPGNVSFTMQIDLEGNFNITGAIVQADNNDTYLLQYWDESNDTWQSLYTANTVGGGGLTTRPSGDQATYAAVTPVTTDLVRVVGVSGDAGLAVSEVELQGTAVLQGTAAPEPATFAMLGAGLLSAAAIRRLRKSNQNQ